MDNYSMGRGLMAVFVVSGSVAYVAHQFHKRLLSQFIYKFESELVVSNKHHMKKKVRFADDVAQPIGHRKKHPRSQRTVLGGHDSTLESSKVTEFESMPLNRQVLYKGIIQSKCLQGQYI